LNFDFLLLRWLLLHTQSLSNHNLPFTCLNCPSFAPDPLDFIIKCSLLIEVAHFVFVCLILEILPFLLCHCLPLLSHLLHDLKSSHSRVGLDN
jgi:hypothetical protein